MISLLGPSKRDLNSNVYECYITVLWQTRLTPVISNWQENERKKYDIGTYAELDKIQKQQEMAKVLDFQIKSLFMGLL